MSKQCILQQKCLNKWMNGRKCPYEHNSTPFNPHQRRRWFLKQSNSPSPKFSMWTCTRTSYDVPANQILQTCCKAQDGVRPSPDWRRARDRPLTTWIHQIHRDAGISVTDALELAGDRSFWRQIATAGCYGWSLRAMMMMMMMIMMNIHRQRADAHGYSRQHERLSQQ